MDDQQRARELLKTALLDAGFKPKTGGFIPAGPAIAAIASALHAAPEWLPIETAPEGRLVVVGWLDTEDAHYPEQHEFDYLEDGVWAKHEDCVEHARAVAPPGSKMPKEQAPYQWWMDLPAFPATHPQEASDA